MAKISKKQVVEKLKSMSDKNLIKLYKTKMNISGPAYHLIRKEILKRRREINKQIRILKH